MTQHTQPIENRRGDRRKPETNSVEIDGIEQKPLFRPSGSMCITDWAIKLGRTRHGLYWRLKNMPIDLAMTERFKKEQS